MRRTENDIEREREKRENTKKTAHEKLILENMLLLVLRDFENFRSTFSFSDF